MAEQDDFKQAKAHARAKVEFHTHLATDVIVIGMLLAINPMTWSGAL